MIADVQTSDSKFNWRGQIGKLWSNPEKRKLFEKELNLAPLVTGSNDEVDWLKQAQAQSGHTETYHDEFVVWSIRHLGLENVVKVLLLEKRKPSDAIN